jgi:hypothetical protein
MFVQARELQTVSVLLVPLTTDHRSLALAALICPPAVFHLSESKENNLDMLLDKRPEESVGVAPSVTLRCVSARRLTRTHTLSTVSPLRTSLFFSFLRRTDVPRSTGPRIKATLMRFGLLPPPAPMSMRWTR